MALDAVLPQRIGQVEEWPCPLGHRRGDAFDPAPLPELTTFWPEERSPRQPEALCTGDQRTSLAREAWGLCVTSRARFGALRAARSPTLRIALFTADAIGRDSDSDSDADMTIHAANQIEIQSVT